MGDWHNFEIRKLNPDVGFHSVEKTYSDMCSNLIKGNYDQNWVPVSSLIKFLEANQ